MTTNKYVPFSVRAGRRTIPQLGMQDVPRELRVSLWNVIEPWIWSNHGYGDEQFDRKVRWVYNFHAIRWPTNEAPTRMYKSAATERLHKWFMTAEGDDIYDFIEALPRMVFVAFIVEPWDYKSLRDRDSMQELQVRAIISKFHQDANTMLEREGAPYRFVNNLLTPITNETEIDEVQKAATGADRFAPARAHIAEALKHLGARPPAYADCIKQAISAVESALKIVAGDSTWRMQPLLRAFEEKHGELHPALRKVVEKLYDYASDEEGVRHGAATTVTVGEAEARAMLVTCSALMNFLIRKASSPSR